MLVRTLDAMIYPNILGEHSLVQITQAGIDAWNEGNGEVRR